jgi:hypothetical protein
MKGIAMVEQLRKSTQKLHKPMPLIQKQKQYATQQKLQNLSILDLLCSEVKVARKYSNPRI